LYYKELADHIRSRGKEKAVMFPYPLFSI